MRINRHDRRTANPPRQGAFTLTELMIVVAIIAILAAVAAPSLDSALMASKLRSYANELVAGSFLARGEAIKRNAVVTMCVSTDGLTCATGGWEQGWIVLAGTEVLMRQQAAASGYRVTGSVSAVTFQPTGFGAQAATITACRASPVGSQERVVRISTTGRASVSKTTTGSCT